jgi:hypothetical protein
MAAHFAGRIAPSEERSMRQHLGGCAQCRRRYERHLLLAELEPNALVPQERIGRGLGVLRRGGPARPIAGALMATAAVCGLVALLRPSGPTADSEFAARGARPPSTASHEVYHAQPGHPFELARDSNRANDELAFAYTNQAAYPFLAVCAIDEHRHVYWYHPAWTSPAQDPDSVRIEEGARLRELPEAISQTLDGHELRVVATFSASPLHVQQVERALSAAEEGRPLQSRFVDAFGQVDVVEQTFRVAP